MSDTFTLNVMGLDITVTRATTPDAAPVVQIDSAGVKEDEDGSPLIRVYVNDGCVYEGAEYLSETDAEDDSDEPECPCCGVALAYSSQVPLHLIAHGSIEQTEDWRAWRCINVACVEFAVDQKLDAQP